MNITPSPEQHQSMSEAQRQWALPLAIFVTGLLLLGIANFRLPYEQDEAGKAAQILLLVQNNSMWQPTAVANIYREFEFSGYYLFSALGYSLIGGEIITYLNVQSLFFGLLFFTSIMLLLRRVYDASPWLTFLVFANIPIVLITFTYGNEVALSLSLFTFSLWLALSPKIWRLVMAIVFLTISLFTRVDIVLWLPFWFAWTAYHIEPTGWQNKNWKRSSLAAILLIIFVLGFWGVFLRELPSTSLRFEYNTNLKLLIGFLTFPFNLSVLAIGGLVLVWQVYHNWKVWWIYLLLFIPLIFYALNLSSPKYIISLALLFGIPTVWVLQHSSLNFKALIFVSIFLWWFISVTPYGVKGPIQGAYWFLPTDDGPIPTGAYMAFYQNVRTGFYQERYLPEIEGVAAAIEEMGRSEDNLILLGRFNPQFYNQELISRQLWSSRSAYPWAIEQLPISENHSIIMMQRSYLHLGYLVNPTKEKVRQWLVDGQVTAVSNASNHALPLLIQIGDDIPPNTDTALGQRILFMADYFGGHKAVPSSRFIESYRSLCWLPTPTYNGAVNPVYQDKAFVAVPTEVLDCTFFNAAMPFTYYGEADPRPGNW